MGCLYLPFPVPCSVDFWGPLCSTVWWSVPETRRGAGRGNRWRETLSRERDTFPEGAEETKLKTRSLRLVSKAGGSAFSRRDSGKGKGSFTQETRTWSKPRWRSGNHHIQDQTVTWQRLTTSPPTGSTHWKLSHVTSKFADGQDEWCCLGFGKVQRCFVYLDAAPALVLPAFAAKSQKVSWVWATQPLPDDIPADAGRAPRSWTIFVLLFPTKTIGWNLCLCWVKRVGWEIGVKTN